MTVNMDEPVIACSGGCGVKFTEQQAEQAGWVRLPITGRMRCGTCTRELEAVGKLGGPLTDTKEVT